MKPKRGHAHNKTRWLTILVEIKEHSKYPHGCIKYVHTKNELKFT